MVRATVAASWAAPNPIYFPSIMKILMVMPLLFGINTWNHVQVEARVVVETKASEAGTTELSSDYNTDEGKSTSSSPLSRFMSKAWLSWLSKYHAPLAKVMAAATNTTTTGGPTSGTSSLLSEDDPVQTQISAGEYNNTSSDEGRNIWAHASAVFRRSVVRPPRAASEVSLDQLQCVIRKDGSMKPEFDDRQRHQTQQANPWFFPPGTLVLVHWPRPDGVSPPSNEELAAMGFSTTTSGQHRGQDHATEAGETPSSVVQQELELQGREKTDTDTLKLYRVTPGSLEEVGGSGKFTVLTNHLTTDDGGGAAAATPSSSTSPADEGNPGKTDTPGGDLLFYTEAARAKRESLLRKYVQFFPVLEVAAVSSKDEHHHGPLTLQDELLPRVRVNVKVKAKKAAGRVSNSGRGFEAGMNGSAPYWLYLTSGAASGSPEFFFRPDTEFSEDIPRLIYDGVHDSTKEALLAEKQDDVERTTRDYERHTSALDSTSGYLPRFFRFRARYNVHRARKAKEAAESRSEASMEEIAQKVAALAKDSFCKKQKGRTGSIGGSTTSTETSTEMKNTWDEGKSGSGMTTTAAAPGVLSLEDVESFEVSMFQDGGAVFFPAELGPEEEKELCSLVDCSSGSFEESNTSREMEELPSWRRACCSAPRSSHHQHTTSDKNDENVENDENVGHLKMSRFLSLDVANKHLTKKNIMSSLEEKKQNLVQKALQKAPLAKMYFKDVKVGRLSLSTTARREQPPKVVMARVFVDALWKPFLQFLQKAMLTEVQQGRAGSGAKFSLYEMLRDMPAHDHVHGGDDIDHHHDLYAAAARSTSSSSSFVTLLGEEKSGATGPSVLWSAGKNDTGSLQIQIVRGGEVRAATPFEICLAFFLGMFWMAGTVLLLAFLLAVATLPFWFAFLAVPALTPGISLGWQLVICILMLLFMPDIRLKEKTETVVRKTR